MHHLYLTRLNYLAVAAAALAAFFIGAVWYTVLFGKLWAAKHGYTPEQLQQMQSKRPMPVFFAEVIFCYFIAAVGIDILLVDFPNVEMVTGIHLGLICWSIVAAFRMTAHLSSPKQIGAFLIDAGYDLVVALPVMGAILAYWRFILQIFVVSVDHLSSLSGLDLSTGHSHQPLKQRFFWPY